MQYTRLLDKDTIPDEKTILATIGNTGFWLEMRAWLDLNYDIKPELVYGGKKYGWCYKYRKGGRTLTCLYPEQGAFTVLIVLGGKEMEKYADVLANLSPLTKQQLDNTHQYHDGKWLWLRVTDKEQIADVQNMLPIKRKPRPPKP